MKNNLTALVLCLTMSSSFAAEKQKVCIDKMAKDGKVFMYKDGKPQQDCKMMKIHKKLKGTPVPSKKKKIIDFKSMS